MNDKRLVINKRLIGAHVSAAGGVEKAVERAAEIGCNCVQVFSGSPRVWAKKPLVEHDSEKIYSNQLKLNLSPIFTHAIYLTNLASDKPELRQKSINSLIYDLQFDAHVKGAGVVVHLGSHQGRGWEAVRQQVAEDIVAILSQTPQASTLLIENSAGQNGKLCSDLSEIRWLLDRVGELGKKIDNQGKIKDRIGWCFDTCHAHAAGYYLGATEPVLHSQTELLSGNAKNPIRGSAIEVIDQYDLLGSLKLIHVNDSRDPFGSGRDRHANLGGGQIDQADLHWFLNHSVLKHIPLVLEVPGDGNGPDAKNVNKLKGLVEL